MRAGPSPPGRARPGCAGRPVTASWACQSGTAWATGCSASGTGGRHGRLRRAQGSAGLIRRVTCGRATGAVAPLAVQGVAARPRPGRQLPARLPLLHCGAYPVDHDAECRDHGGKGHETAQATPGMVGIAEAIRIEDVGADPHGGERNGQAAARPGGRPGQRAAARRDRRARRPGCGRKSGESGESGETGKAGMSAVRAARSAPVRAASARPARTSSSSLVSRPCTNASFSASITCSRSAWPALSRSRPAAAGSCGCVITGTSPLAHMRVKRNAAAPAFPNAGRLRLTRRLPRQNRPGR